MLSIYGAAERGIERLRLPNWADPLDHLKLDIFDGKPGPWTHLYSPCNPAVNGRNPVDLICLEMDYAKLEWEEYTGPLPDSDEYKTAIENKNRLWQT